MSKRLENCVPQVKKRLAADCAK